jgi:Flp pilus assembly protein TadG
VNRNLVSENRGALRRLVARIGRDEGGTTLLEFAFVAGPFFALIFAILQTALIFFANQALDTATQSASRLILTGQTQATSATPMTKAAFKTATCARLPTFMDCSNLTVDVTVAGAGVDAFSGASMGRPTETYAGGNAVLPNNYNTGKEGDIVIVRLMYPWNVVGAEGLNLSTMLNGQHLLVATTITQTEPYR